MRCDLTQCSFCFPLSRVFRQYDTRSSGYINNEQFVRLLADLCALSAEDAHALLLLVDPSLTGRITYHALYHRLYLVR